MGSWGGGVGTEHDEVGEGLGTMMLGIAVAVCMD